MYGTSLGFLTHIVSWGPDIMPETTPPPANGTATTVPPSVQPVAEYVRGLMHEHGNNERSALRKAGKDNQKLRRRNAALTQELEGLRTRNPQGSVVLIGEDVTTWNELKPVLTLIKEKGVKVADVPKVFKERDDLLLEKNKQDSKSAARKAGEALGFKGDGLDLFEQLATDKGLTFEEKEVTVMKGKKPVKEKRWHAKKATDGDKATPVLVEDLDVMKPWLKALRAASTEDGDSGDGSSEDDLEASGDDAGDTEAEEVRTLIPEQRTSGKGRGKPKDIAGSYVEKNYPLPSEVAKVTKKDKE